MTIDHKISSDINISNHQKPSCFRDCCAFRFVKILRFFADTFFAKRYGHRAVVLETVAAVPGMVGGLLQHLKSLRRMADDNGLIKTLFGPYFLFKLIFSPRIKFSSKTFPEIIKMRRFIPICGAAMATPSYWESSASFMSDIIF